jgi:hypothetical protein
MGGQGSSGQQALYNSTVTGNSMKSNRPLQYVPAVIQGLLSHDAHLLLTQRELAAKALDMAEALVDEINKRGY